MPSGQGTVQSHEPEGVFNIIHHGPQPFPSDEGALHCIASLRLPWRLRAPLGDVLPVQRSGRRPAWPAWRLGRRELTWKGRGREAQGKRREAKGWAACAGVSAAIGRYRVSNSAHQSSNCNKPLCHITPAPHERTATHIFRQ